MIIPVFNCETYLHEAISSILAQSRAPMEIIVIDDGSSDSSASVAENFGPPVRCVRQEHLGAAAARNRGVQLSQGEWLAFLDADDLWLPDKLKLQLAALSSLPARFACFCHMMQFVSGNLPGLQAENKVLAGASICTLLVRRTDFLEVGEFSTRWSRGEFLDWYTRAEEIGLKFHMVPEVLARRRLHKGNLERNNANFNEYALIIHEARKRRSARNAQQDS